MISLDTGERQSVLLDVMPLINGYLPLPLVRLSKYIPADIKLSSTRGLYFIKVMPAIVGFIRTNKLDNIWAEIASNY